MIVSVKKIDPKHIIQGTGYGLILPHWKEGLADEIITVTDDEVLEMTKQIALEQGFYVGYSAGANVAAATKYLSTTKSTQNVVSILCDTGYKYTDI